MPQISVLRLPAVVSKTGLARATLYLKMKEGFFPKPIPLGPRAVGWIEAEIDEWLALQVAARNKPECRP